MTFFLFAFLFSEKVFAAEIGMPQFNVHTYPSQVFWLLITFFCLFLAMWKIAFPMFRQILKKRGKAMSDNLDKAEELRKEALSYQEEAKKILQDASSQSQNIIDQTLLEISDLQQQKLEEFDRKLDDKFKQAHIHIEKQKKKALDEVPQIALSLTKIALKKISDEDVSDQIIESLMKEK